MKTTLFAKVIAMLATGAVLASCESETAPPSAQDEGRAAKGEVLGGTISDDMLPLDTLRSQSPPQRAATGGSGGSAQTDAEEGDNAAEVETNAPSEPVEATEAEIEDAE